MTLNTIEPFDIQKSIETNLKYIYDSETQRSASLIEDTEKQNYFLADPKSNPIFDIVYNEFEKKIFICGLDYFKCFEMAGCQVSFD
jgi:hypothetical protein